VVSSDAGAPTVSSQVEAKRSELEQGVRADPLVQAVLTRFPGAEIVDVRRRDDENLGDEAAGEAGDPSDKDEDV
jgi:DNA polymerase III subunit gamma/tau